MIALGTCVVGLAAGSADAASAPASASDGFETAAQAAPFSSSSVVTITGKSAQEGSYYARVTSTSASRVAVGVVGPSLSGLAVGTPVTASCWVRSNAGYAAIIRVTETSSGAQPGVQEQSGATSLSWAKISETYTVAQAGSTVSLAAYSTGPTSTNNGGLGVDNCSLVAGAATPSSATASEPVAPPMPTTVPTGFTRAFTEDFNTAAPAGTFDSVYGSKFAEYSGCCSTNGQTVYSSAKVLSVANGSLYYNLHSENGVSYAATPVPGKYLNFEYGQVGMSIRLDSSVDTGYKLAFLLWPQSDQWTNEVDFPEVYPDFTQPMYAASLHTTTASSGPHSFAGGPMSNSGVSLADHKYHTFLLDWRPGQLTATIDGKVVGSFTGDAVPSQLMHFVMQTEGWVNQGPVPADATAQLEVPWVYINTYNG